MVNYLLREIYITYHILFKFATSYHCFLFYICRNFSKYVENFPKSIDFICFKKYNIINMEQQDLVNLSIFELRNLARKVGVFNPTVLKKQDLIQAICDVQDGKVKPHVAKTKQGRPPKEIGGYDKLVGIFLPKNILDIKTEEEVNFERRKALAESIGFEDNPTVREGVKGKYVRSGYLEILSNATGLLRSKICKTETAADTTFLTSQIIQKYGLRSGDHILCMADKVDEDRAYVLTDITTINGVPVLEHSLNRLSFDYAPYNLNASLIKFEIEPLKSFSQKIKMFYGDTVFCYPETSDDFYYFVTQLNNEHCFDNTIYISPSITAKDYEILKNYSCEIFGADFCEYTNIQGRASLLGANRAKRLAEQGKNVCLIINDLVTLVMLDGYFKDMSVSKTIISQAKNLEQGSITIFCNFPKLPRNYVNELLSLTFPKIETVSIKLNDKKIDVDNSYRK